MTEKKDTKWKKGQSGNMAGRPPNSSNKSMTDRQLADLCSKKVKGAMNVVLAIMNDSNNENAKLKAALAIIAQDKLIVTDWDNAYMLKERVQTLEHSLYPTVVKSLIESRKRVS